MSETNPSTSKFSQFLNSTKMLRVHIAIGVLGIALFSYVLYTTASWAKPTEQIAVGFMIAVALSNVVLNTIKLRRRKSEGNA
jgi:cell division septal protein FtsQ